MRHLRRFLSVGSVVAMAALPAAAPAETAVRLVALRVGDLRASIAPSHGGELAGLEILSDGYWAQLLYRGDDYAPTKDWAGKAPVLWPATGRNTLPAGDPKAGEAAWRVAGAVYPMTIHGFARDLPWTLDRLEQGRGRAHAMLSLKDTPQTRAHYPFGFRITTDYILTAGVLTIRQTVHADQSNSGSMPFSIGNHLTFNLPLVPGADAAGVRFETPARRKIVTDAQGLPTGKVEPVDFSRPTPVSDLKTRIAVSVGDYASTAPWVKVSDPAGLDVTVSHIQSATPAGAPVMFNLWGDVKTGFFAPEPWVGKQNALVTGDGIIALAPGQDFDWAISVVVRGHAPAPPQPMTSRPQR